MNIKCGHLSNVEDSDGIHDTIALFKVSPETINKFREWKDRGSWRRIEVDDDSGRHGSNNRYQCINIIYEYGHGLIKLRKKR